MTVLFSKEKKRTNKWTVVLILCKDHLMETPGFYECSRILHSLDHLPFVLV